MTIIKFMWKRERKKNKNYTRNVCLNVCLRNVCLNTKKKYYGFTSINLDLNYNIYSCRTYKLYEI